MDIHWWAVIVAVLINMVLGALWYSPVLFGKKWMKLVGLSETDAPEMKKMAPKAYLGSALGSIVLALVLSFFVDWYGALIWTQGVFVAFLAWVGFVVPTSLNTILYENRSKGVFYINMGYYLVSFILMGIVLAVWR